MPFKPANLAHYPKEPGVYLMKDIDGSVLYVGKAKNLRNRLKQYFIKESDERPYIPYLIPQIETIETIVTTSEKEALLLENTLIKKHQPKYNILLKDDKTFISLVITDHVCPQVKVIRYKTRPPKDNNHYFGPYTNARAARETLDLLIKIFRFRQCSDVEFQRRKRPCILYDMKKCLAPCVGLCSMQEYQNNIHQAEKLLKGQTQEVLHHLKKQMFEASELLQFEKAKEIRDMIHRIEHVMQIQHVDNISLEDCDVIGFYKEKDTIFIVVLNYRNFKLIGSSHYTFFSIIGEEEDILENFILQHYQKNNVPNILVPLKLSNADSLEEILQEKNKKKIKLLFPEKGEKKRLIELAQKNAFVEAQRQQNLSNHQDKLLLELEEILKLEHYPYHIDCFDISHHAGSYPVASKIRFTNGMKDKSHTRYFHIESEEKGDIPQLKHVLERYLSKAKTEKTLPNLLVVDGGKGQYNAAKQILDKLNIVTVDIIAISKESGLHTKGLTQEKIISEKFLSPLLLDIHSPLLHFLQLIRDEAHRSAIGFERRTQKKATIKTALTSIPGIGPKKTLLLLQTFKSLENLKRAPLEEIEKLPSINKKDIENLKKFFEKN
jgi:excinuclease ABC subunit C